MGSRIVPDALTRQEPFGNVVGRYTIKPSNGFICVQSVRVVAGPEATPGVPEAARLRNTMTGLLHQGTRASCRVAGVGVGFGVGVALETPPKPRNEHEAKVLERTGYTLHNAQKCNQKKSMLANVSTGPSGDVLKNKKAEVVPCNNSSKQKKAYPHMQR